MSFKTALGKSGEEASVRHLLKNGYKVIARNFRIRNGEIDIVAIDESEKEPTLCFIEIKTRSSHDFGTPLESITPWKLKALIRSAQFYKMTHKNLPDALRIDAVSILVNTRNEIDSIEITKNISGF